MGRDWEDLLDADGDDIQEAYDELIWRAELQERELEERKKENQRRHMEELKEAEERKKREEKKKKAEQLLQKPENRAMLCEAERQTLKLFLEKNIDSVDMIEEELFKSFDKNMLFELDFTVNEFLSNVENNGFDDKSKRTLLAEKFNKNAPVFYPWSNPYEEFDYFSRIEIRLNNGVHLYIPNECGSVFAIYGKENGIQEELICLNEQEGYYKFYFEIGTNCIAIKNKNGEIIKIEAEYLPNHRIKHRHGYGYLETQIRQSNYATGGLAFYFDCCCYLDFYNRMQQRDEGHFLYNYREKIMGTAWVDEDGLRCYQRDHLPGPQHLKVIEGYESISLERWCKEGLFDEFLVQMSILEGETDINGDAMVEKPEIKNIYDFSKKEFEEIKEEDFNAIEEYMINEEFSYFEVYDDADGSFYYSVYIDFYIGSYGYLTQEDIAFMAKKGEQLESYLEHRIVYVESPPKNLPADDVGQPYDEDELPFK